MVKKVKYRGALQRTRLIVVVCAVAIIGAFFIVFSKAATPSGNMGCASNTTAITFTYTYGTTAHGVDFIKTQVGVAGQQSSGSDPATSVSTAKGRDGGTVSQGASYVYVMLDHDTRGEIARTPSCSLKSTSPTGGTTTPAPTGTLGCASNTTAITLAYTYTTTSSGVDFVKTQVGVSGQQPFGSDPAVTVSSTKTRDGGSVSQGASYVYVMLDHSNSQELARTPNCSLKAPAPTGGTTSGGTTSGGTSTSPPTSPPTTTSSVKGTLTCASNTTNITLSYTYSTSSGGVDFVKTQVGVSGQQPFGSDTTTSVSTAKNKEGGTVKAGAEYVYVLLSHSDQKEIARTPNCSLKSATPAASADPAIDNSSGGTADPGNTAIDDSAPLDFGAADDTSAAAFDDNSGVSVDTVSDSGLFADDTGISLADWGGDYSGLGDTSSSNGNDSGTTLDLTDGSQFTYDDNGNIIDTSSGEIISPNSVRGKAAAKILHAKAIKTSNIKTAASGAFVTVALMIIGFFGWLIIRSRRLDAGQSYSSYDNYDASTYFAAPTAEQPGAMTPAEPVSPDFTTMAAAQSFTPSVPVAPAANSKVESIINQTFYPGQPQSTTPDAQQSASNEPLDMFEIANQYPMSFGNNHNVLQGARAPLPSPTPVMPPEAPTPTLISLPPAPELTPDEMTPDGSLSISHNEPPKPQL
jgi:hypothetical protein